MTVIEGRKENIKIKHEEDRITKMNADNLNLNTVESTKRPCDYNM